MGGSGSNWCKCIDGCLHGDGIWLGLVAIATISIDG